MWCSHVFRGEWRPCGRTLLSCTSYWVRWDGALRGRASTQQAEQGCQPWYSHTSQKEREKWNESGNRERRVKQNKERGRGELEKEICIKAKKDRCPCVRLAAAPWRRMGELTYSSRYSLDRRFGGPRDWCRRGGEVPAHAGNRTPIIQLNFYSSCAVASEKLQVSNLKSNKIFSSTPLQTHHVCVCCYRLALNSLCIWKSLLTKRQNVLHYALYNSFRWLFDVSL